MLVVAASGGFDPLHVGHVRYLEAAKALGDRLVVIVNGDSFLMRKKGYIFMPLQERVEIIGALACVDEVYPFESDKDDVCDALRAIRPAVFAKGGDRNRDNVPEMGIIMELGIVFVDGVGGRDKPQSSSWLVDKFRRNTYGKTYVE